MAPPRYPMGLAVIAWQDRATGPTADGPESGVPCGQSRRGLAGRGLPEEALLGHARDAHALAVVHAGEDQAAGRVGGGALADVENPVVEARGAVEPHRVVEAGGGAAGHPDAVVVCNSGDEPAIAQVDHRGGVEDGVFGEGCVHLAPDHAGWELAIA